MKKPKSRYKSRFKLSPLAQSLDFVTKPIFANRGFAQSKIITQWHLIVGDDLAKFSSPKKLTYAKNQKYGATLYIEVYNSGKAMEFSYNRPIIIEKIAMYFGYKAVAQIKIIQKPINDKFNKQKHKAEVKKSFNSEQLKALIADIEDEDLRKSLNEFGLNIRQD